MSLPTYPWQRERFWPEVSPVERTTGVVTKPALDEAHRDWMYVSRWVPAPVQTENATPRSWLIVGSGDVAALRDALGRVGAGATVVPTIDAAADALRKQREAADRGIVVLTDPNDDRIAWHAVEALRSFQDAHGDRAPTPRIWWVTRGAHRVANEMPSTRAARQGSLWGAARVLAAEHPDWWGGLVDLDGEPSSPASMDALASHLVASGNEDQVAIRGGARFALRLQRAGDFFGTKGASMAWRSDGAYLITGGFGGVAQQIAREMVRQGARRLVLLGRSALPPRTHWNAVANDDPAAERIAFVRALEHEGVSVHLIQADIADAAQVENALDAYAAEGWPAIVGVIHAAGVLDSHLVGDMDASAFDRVVGPKLDGALVLDRLFPRLDMFVLFSSMSAFWAPGGMVNYAAANAGVDALAVARRARGQHAVSIQWGPWENTGLHRREDVERSTDQLNREGVQAFTAAQATRFLSPVASGAQPVVAVVSIDWTKFAEARRGREPALFRDLLGAPISAPSGDGLRAQLFAATDVARRALLESTVRSALGTVLRRRAELFDAHQRFGTMGLDSLMALELRNRLESALERALPATLAWNYPTIAQLVPYLETLIGDGPASTRAAELPAAASTSPAAEEEESAVTAQPVPQASPAIDSIFGDVAQLSDEDIARALRGGA